MCKYPLYETGKIPQGEFWRRHLNELFFSDSEREIFEGEKRF
jgi:hypothetical protein